MRRQKVPFEPLQPGKVGVYVCGPTTYAPAHIGHAYSAIAFDTVRRGLEFLGWDVKYVRNVTDIDAVVAALTAGVPAARLIDGIVLAACQRLLRFDGSEIDVHVRA